MKYVLFFISTAGILYAAINWSRSGATETVRHVPVSKSEEPSYLIKLKNKAGELKDFIAEKKYNDSVLFYIDMSLSSASRRFMVYQLGAEKVVASGLVTHGRCNQYWLEGRKYSNVIGSGCTSPGKYKIGHSYQGRFGLAFKLHGLDSSNSNAYKRYVVLHAHECVPENSVSYEICQSDGCPTVSPGFLKQLEGIIKNSSKPVLLYIDP